MSRFRFLLLLMALFAAACSPNSSTPVGELPTLFVNPTLTPSDTPTNTPTPTDTPIPTDTPTVTPSHTPTNTPTTAPTNTYTPRATLTPSITPTATLAPPTATSTTVATLSTAQIITFEASTNTAVTGGQVTLTWNAVGDVILIERLNLQGIVLETFRDLQPQGSQVFVMPTGEGTAVVYRLVARRGTDEKTATQQINLSGTTTCPNNWFFGNQLAPAGAGCPTGPEVIAAGSAQPFERGLMIHYTGNNQNLVYGLANAGGMLTQNAYIRQNNGWDNITVHTCGTPPPPLVEPQQMFAWLYCTTFGPIDTWNNNIGWATAPLSTNSQLRMQRDQSGATYIEIPSGEVYRLEPIPEGNLYAAWTKLR